MLDTRYGILLIMILIFILGTWILDTSDHDTDTGAERQWQAVDSPIQRCQTEY